MTSAESPASRWWSAPPRERVSWLSDVDSEVLELALDPLPDGAPAVVSYRPPAGRSFDGQLTALLDELERGATRLFPSWLPGAERLSGPQGLGVAAVRALAAERAAASANFGPYLADLAERGLRGRATGGRHFPPEVRAAGLARVLADAYGRDSTVLLMTVADGLGAADETTLVGTAEWLAQHGFTIWLTGAPLLVADRVRTVPVRLPSHFTRVVADVPAASVARAGDLTVAIFPPLAGQPRADSLAECALERALAPHDWAHGRQWNRNYSGHALAVAYRLDLFWPDEGVVVEVDGPEHHAGRRYAADRDRDVRLQLLGHDVLRFTNDQVLGDVQAVVHSIRLLLDKRRCAAPTPGK